MVGENVGVGSGGVDQSTAGPLFTDQAWPAWFHQPITVAQVLTANDEKK